MFLTLEGFEVLTATDGESGLAMAREARPDVVVMDLQMPGLSGAQVSRALREDPATKDIPLIAATGHAHARLDDAVVAGFDALIVKPCDPDRLVVEIRRLTTARAN